MEIEKKEINYYSAGAQIRAYFAAPRGGSRLPGIVLIHDIFGLSDNLRDIANRFASEGYAVIAPHLYSRPGNPSPEEIEKSMAFIMSIPPSEQRNQDFVKSKMADLPESERQMVQRTWSWMTNRSYSTNIEDLKAAFRWLSENEAADRNRIGCLGFCMGGTLAGRLACSIRELKASVIFYGENPPPDKIADIRCPVLGLYGGEDHRITDKVPELEKAMKAAGKSFEYKIYPGAHHAFFSSVAKSYNESAAKDSWNVVIGFLSQKL